jgi:hypothetical protein
MNICHAAKRWIRLGCLLAGVPFLIPPVYGADANPPKVFGGTQIQEIYRIRLDRGDLAIDLGQNITGRRRVDERLPG